MTAFMSRTDKTAPGRVKAFYYPSWVAESHDHTSGVCELPETPTVENIGEYDCLYLHEGVWGPRPTEFDHLHWKDRPSFPQRFTCHWEFSHEFYCVRLASGCGCKMCSYDGYDSTPRYKRERINARRYCRSGWTKEY